MRASGVLIPRSLRLLPLVAVLAACQGPVATSIQPNTTSVGLDAIGATAQLSAQVLDQDGNLLDSVPAWTSDAPGVATVSASGTVTAVASGTATITVSSGAASAEIAVTVSQVRTSIAKLSGDAQTGEVGTALAQALEVEVRDRLDVGIPDVSVSFSVTSGGGAVGSSSVTTDGAGRASITWTLGTNAAATQSVAAASGPVSATFTASAVAGAPDALTKEAGDGQARAAGQPLRDSVVARVVDQFGNPVVGAEIGFVVTSGGGSASPATVAADASGLSASEWTLGPDIGTQTLEARVAGLVVEFTAEATVSLADSVAAFEGEDQAGLVDFEVNIPPAVQVFDPNGDPFAGATVVFEVTAGGGSVTGETVVTGTDGVARVGSWTLGPTPATNQLTATVVGAGIADNPITFTAMGEAGSYDIEIRYINGTSPSAAQQQAVDDAVATWETVIFQDVVDVAVNVPADACISGQPALIETIDDIVVFVEFAAIDGSGGILAQAGHCDNLTNPLRSSDSLPVIGILIMDSADLPGLETNGQLTDVIVHELGHALGFNRTLFTLKDFLRNPSLDEGAGADTHFDGPMAVREMDANGGSNYSGAKVPLENNAVAGQADSHWRESVFDTELMTPFIESPGTMMPFSRVTAAAMLDLRYGVNLAGAVTIDLGFGLAVGPRMKVDLGQDVVFVNLDGTGATGTTLR